MEAELVALYLDIEGRQAAKRRRFQPVQEAQVLQAEPVFLLDPQAFPRESRHSRLGLSQGLGAPPGLAVDELEHRVGISAFAVLAGSRATPGLRGQMLLQAGLAAPLIFLETASQQIGHHPAARDVMGLLQRLQLASEPGSAELEHLGVPAAGFRDPRGREGPVRVHAPLEQGQFGALLGQRGL